MAETAAASPTEPTGSAQPLSRPPADRTPPKADPGRQRAWLAGTHPVELQMKAEAAAKANAIDSARPQKNVQPPPDPPAVGSTLWARQAQPTLGGKTPEQVHAAWHQARFAASGDEARARLAREWGRHIHPGEQAAIPGVDAAVRAKWSDPEVQRDAASSADRKVPEAIRLRRQLSAAQVPAGSAYSVG